MTRGNELGDRKYIRFSLELVIENIVSMSVSFSLEMILSCERWLTTSECARHMWSTHKESVPREALEDGHIKSLRIDSVAEHFQQWLESTCSPNTTIESQVPQSAP